MKFNSRSLRLFAIFATATLALIACQNSTEPNRSESGPISLIGSYTMANSSRLPDSISWKAPKDSGSQKQQCNTTTLECLDTFRLSAPIGKDSIALQLWTLGIRTYTLYFGEGKNATTLGLRPTFLCDSLDTLLLSRYNALTSAQKASFSALGQGAPSLVTYYASLLLSGDPLFAGKALPVGMNLESVGKNLVYLASKQGMTVNELMAKNILPGMDSSTVLLNVKLLIKAGALRSDDSAVIFPPYPVRVKTPITVNGTLTAGGSAISVSGAFVWTKGQNIKAPAIRVRTVRSGDSAYFTTPTKQFTSTDTIWNLDGNLSLQASSSASAETDTLVITLSDDSGHSATSRTAFQVTSSAGIPNFSPNGGTFYTTQNVTVAAASADSIQISTDSATWTKYTSAVPVTSSAKLYARTFKGGTASPVTSAAFIIGTVPAPSISPNGGSFYGTDTVDVVASGSDSIQFSTDSASWTKYTTKIVVTSSRKLFARAFKDGVASAVVSAAFTASTAPVPTIAPNGGTFYRTQTVTVLGPTGTDSVQTSTDSATWNKYTQTISITASGKLYARSFAGGVASPVVLAVFTIGTVPVPSFTPNGGIFYGTTSVIVAAAGSDSIQTSTDSASWTKYSTPVVVTSTQKLYARAFKGGVASTVASASFVLGTVPVPSFTPNGGTFYGTTSVIIAAAGSDSIQTSTDSSTWTKYSTAMAVTSTQKLYARAFKGDVASTVASASFVLGTVPMPSFTPNGGSFYGSTTVTVAATGSDSIQTSTDSSTWTKYSTAMAVSSTQKLYARAFKGGVASTVSIAAFTSSAIPVPTIAPNGGTFYSTQSISITAPTGTDSIQTSKDSIAWTRYTQEVTISSSGKLYARSFAGGVASPVVSATFTMATVPVPSITPNGGTFYTAQNATVIAAGTDSIQTSTDSATWTKYSTAQVVSSTQKLYARAFKGGVASAVVSASYVIGTVPAPVFSPNGGVVSTTQDITVTAVGSDSIQTSLDGTTNWTKYASALQVSANRSLYARAFKGGVASTVISAAFTVPPAPVITPNGGAFTTAKSVTITASAGTIEDSLSTGTTWAPYVSALSVGQNIKLFARTVLNGAVSEVVEADFAFPPRMIDSVSKDTGTVARVTLLAPGSDNIWVTSDRLTWTKLKHGDSYAMTASGILLAYAVTGKATSATDSITVNLYQRPPSISPAGGIFPFAKTVTITPSVSGSEIYYTTDGSAPASSVTGSTFKYSAPFVVGASKRVKAIAVKSGIVPSVARSDSFAIADTTTYGNPWKPGFTYGAFQDSRDQRVYRSIVIGTQTWMADNLNYAGVTLGVGGCYGGSADSCKKYGRLYALTDLQGGQYSNSTTHLGVKGICPTGWHHPSDSEWVVLQKFVSGPGDGWDGKMLMTTGWLNWDAESTLGTDSFGFRALPGGYFDGTSFAGATSFGGMAQWWAATEFGVGYTGTRNMSGFYVLNSSSREEDGAKLSLRCVKD